MKAAKTIDEIYDEVRSYDIVISNDASLVAALNNRIDVPWIGRLASTPMMIAKDHEDLVLERLMASGKCSRDGKRGIMDDVKLLETVTELTGYDIKFVHGEIENIRKIRRYTEKVENFLFGKQSKVILREFEQQPTYEMVMSAFGAEEQEVAYSGKSIAVIGIDLFNDLDKHFIPYDFKYTEIDIFKDGRYDIETVHMVGNDRQVAEHAIDLISNDIAEDVAIVMDTKGAIADAVRSALYRKGIAFKNTLPARDLDSVRDLMEFVRKALNYEILTVGDVRELFAGYGTSIGTRHDEYLLCRHARSVGGKFEELSSIMENIKEHTFSGLCERIADDSHRITIKMILDGLNMNDTMINERTAGTLSYLINSMDGIKHNAEIPDDEKRGVLLADCTNSVFIDRPFVIYLNMDSSWSSPADNHRYTDRDAEEEKDAMRFQVLLQQGSSRMYIVNTMKNGKPARPCILFDVSCREDDDDPLKRKERFADLTNTDVIRITWVRGPEPPLKRMVGDVIPDDIGKLSKSSLNEYIDCPRKYMFGRLVGSPDSEHTVFGNMVHEFAEFCVCYPEIAKNNIDRCTEMISENYAGISCPERNELDRSKIRFSLTNMLRFADTLDALPLNKKMERDNRFFKEFGLDMTSDAVEADRASNRYPLHGKFDLLVGNKIIDYKTGRPKDILSIAREMDLKKETDYTEMQPLVYLTVLGDTDGEKEFILLYLMDNETAAADGHFKISDNMRRAVLLNMRKEDIIRNGMLWDHLMRTKTRRENLSGMEEGFGHALIDAGIQNAENWHDDIGLHNRILELQSKRTKTVKDAVASAIKAAGKYISGCFIREGDEILVPLDSAEMFGEYVRTVHSRITEQQVSGFPCEPRKSCDRCGFRQICTDGGGDDDDGPE